MFYKGSPEISYIGKFFMYVPQVGYYKSDVLPISSIDSRIINKDTISRLFDEEIQNFRTFSEKAKIFVLKNGKDSNTTLKYEREFRDPYNTKLGFMSFEIIEESSLREKQRFLGFAE